MQEAAYPAADSDSISVSCSVAYRAVAAQAHAYLRVDYIRKTGRFGIPYLAPSIAFRAFHLGITYLVNGVAAPCWFLSGILS